MRIPYSNTRKNIDFLWGWPLHKDSPFRMHVHRDSLCGGGHYIRILYVEEAFTKGFISKTKRKY